MANCFFLFVVRDFFFSEREKLQEARQREMDEGVNF